jgi:hypothetical protein
VWNGRKAWQLRLDQKSPNNLRGYRVKNNYYPVKLKARAWIDAETFELLRLETNLQEPVPAIRLEREQAIVDYGKVKFASKDLELWLPQSSDIYMDYRGKKYHFRHSFSDFQLFWVATTEKVTAPKE